MHEVSRTHQKKLYLSGIPLRHVFQFTRILQIVTLNSILSDFPVSKFSGRKQVFLSTATWSGGRDLFLGIAYTTTGAVILLAGCVITAIHLKFKKKVRHHNR